MLSHAILEQLGVFVHPDVLTADQCRDWRQRAVKAESRPGFVYKQGKSRLDEDARRTQEVGLTPEDAKRLDQQIAAVLPALDRHFDMALGPLCEYRCMLYDSGDFFVPHYDVTAVEGETVRNVHKRTVTLLIFLNAPDDPEVPYQGGELTFFGLLDVPDSDQHGFSVEAKQGKLVAFKSDILHSVTPVLSGNRCVIVAWFHDQSKHRETTHGG
jgi:predicted 2-oxoglutarate/Fe(II)-dependent dioxygenase YbiX